MEQVVKVLKISRSEIVSRLNDLADYKFLNRLLHLDDNTVAGSNPVNQEFGVAPRQFVLVRPGRPLLFPDLAEVRARRAPPESRTSRAELSQKESRIVMEAHELKVTGHEFSLSHF